MKADGQQGYFLQRMTPTYASSNGRLDIWWDNRSDFNANGEKAVFFGAMYDLKNWNLPGWAVGASYVYARMLNRQPGKVTRMLTTTKPHYRRVLIQSGCGLYPAGGACQRHHVQTALHRI